MSIAREPERELMSDAAIAQAYAAADFADVNQAFVQRLIDVLPVQDRLHAVDLGCGPADIPIRLIRRRPDLRVLGVDGSEAMLQIARERVHRAGMPDAIAFLLADAKATGLPAHRFDVVFSNSILHHVTSPAAFWSEVRRLGRTGGTVFMRDLARPPSQAEARALVQRYAGAEPETLRDEFFNSLRAAYEIEDVREQLQRAGLDSLAVHQVTDRHLEIVGILP